MLPYPAKIVKIKEEAYAIATYTLAFEDETVRPQYRFRSGQFNMLYLPGIGEVAISISSDPAEPEQLDHTIRYAGNVTRAIGRLKAGDVIGLRGHLARHRSHGRSFEDHPLTLDGYFCSKRLRLKNPGQLTGQKTRHLTRPKTPQLPSVSKQILFYTVKDGPRVSLIH